MRMEEPKSGLGLDSPPDIHLSRPDQDSFVLEDDNSPSESLEAEVRHDVEHHHRIAAPSPSVFRRTWSHKETMYTSHFDTN